MTPRQNPFLPIRRLLLAFTSLWFFSSALAANAELVQRAEWRRPYEASKARAVTAEGNWAYVLTHELYFRVFDISSPDDVKFMGKTALTADPTIRYAWDLAVKGDYVYAVLGGDVQVIDVRNKSAPWKISNFGLAASLSIEIEGDIAYVGTSNAF